LPCAALPEDRLGAAFPIQVGGEVVAVLYADDCVPDRAPSVPSAWPERIDILVRHAARSVEAITLSRAQRLQVIHAAGSTAARVPSRPTPAARKVAVPPPPEPDDEAARRYARLLVSEIKLYYEPAVSEGRRHGDVLARLGPEIARARALYEQRIPREVRTRADYFGLELVRTLANGDPRLLGQVT
jgi:hypothetical protein